MQTQEQIAFSPAELEAFEQWIRNPNRKLAIREFNSIALRQLAFIVEKTLSKMNSPFFKPHTKYAPARKRVE